VFTTSISSNSRGLIKEGDLKNLPTHGSLTKAGKVRSQTPRIETKKKKTLGPRRRNLKNYQRLISGKRDFNRRRRR